MSKTSKQLSIDTDKLLVKSEQSVPDQQTATEMQVYEALRRRASPLPSQTLCPGKCMKGTFRGSFNTFEAKHRRGMPEQPSSKYCVQTEKSSCT